MSWSRRSRSRCRGRWCRHLTNIGDNYATVDGWQDDPEDETDDDVDRPSLDSDEVDDEHEFYHNTSVPANKIRNVSSKEYNKE